ncbi:MAG TPA: sulfite exporter TauE/SafE family protein [Alphaproteobacteria bacterium]|nr:sulfite exporter TauE/SafE family protein [Alphaproteobacteria bacterium]
MDTTLYLPIAQVSVSLVDLVFIGFLGGILTGLVGIGGSILMLPSMILMNIPPFIAITAQNYYAVGTSFTGFNGYKKEHGVDYSLACWLTAGGLLGGVIGHFSLQRVMDSSLYSYFLGALYLGTLLFSLLTLFKNSLNMYKNQRPFKKGEKTVNVPKGLLEKLPFQVHFVRSRVRCSVLLPITLGAFSSFLTTLTGLGVGLLMVPFMTYLLGRTSRSIAGTTLLSGILLSLTAIFVYIFEKTITDFVLVFALLTGGVIGSQFGVQIGYKLKKHTIGFIGSAILVLTLLKLSFNLESILHKQLALSSFPLHLFGQTLSSYFFVERYPYIGPFLGIVLVVFIAVLVELAINRLEALFLKPSFNFRSKR